MTKVTVELVYESAGKPSRQITVEVSDRWQGSALLDRVNKAVEKQEKDDPDWVRWNLINIERNG